MNNKNMAIAIVAILIVAVVGVGVYTFYGNNSDDDSNTMTFLIQDDEGVYFWIKGEGDNGYTAFGNACETYGIEHEISNNGSYGGSIDSVFGMGTVQTEGPSEDNEYGIYIYWNQYSFVNGNWKMNDVSIDQVKTSEVKFMAIVYTDSYVEPLVKPSDAKIWDQSTEGTVFTITSPSGMNFKVNGIGTMVMDAFIDATSAYKIPFEPSIHQGEKSGIDSLFGIETSQVTPPSEDNPYGEYVWWTQMVPEEGGEGWVMSPLGMNLLKTSEYGSILIIYGTGSM